MNKSLLNSSVYLIPLSLLSVVNPVSAQIENEDFSSKLDNWSSLGDAIAIDNQAVITNSSSFGDDLSGVTFNLSGNDPVSAFNLETFLGVSPGTLSPENSLLGATEGSLIAQEFFGSANSTISFDWQFLTNDTAVEIAPGFTEADYGFVAIKSPSSFDLAILSNSGSSSLIPSTDPFGPFDRSTPVNRYSLKLPTNSFYTIAFGVLDVGGSAVSSALVIDNVDIEQNTKVPESNFTTSLLILSLGLAVQTFIKKYLQKIKA